MQLTLSQQISQLQRSGSVRLCDQIIGQGIIRLIQRQPFYGILLAKVDRLANPRITAPLGLGWSNRKIELEYNSKRFADRIDTGSELLFWLEHEALHLIWLHPVRYPYGNWVTQIATDVAVNQLIPGHIDDEITLDQVNQRWGLHLPANVNSKVYIDQLTRFFLKRRSSERDRELVDRRIKRVLSHHSDDHHFWGSEPRLGKLTKLMELKRLVKRSYQNTGAKARGTLPGRVHHQLQKMTVRHVIDWRVYLKLGLGRVPFGRIPSRARFNRRQAYRMDLMGTVSNYLQSVRVFVDNSGSMGDNEISYLLGQLGDFLKHFPVNVSVYDFDTQVHFTHRYQANNYHQLKFVRVGGGGTSFQCIFDYCHQKLRSNPSQLIIILTDGYGERHLNYYGFDNLLWLLTEPKVKFSVKNVRGRVVSLANDSLLRKEF